MICGGEFWSLYQGVKLHFSSDSYDGLKFKFKTNCRPSAYNRRNDRFQFEKLAKEYRTEKEALDFLVANFRLRDHNAWTLTDDSSRETYTSWLKVRDSITYIFEQDAHTLRTQADKEKLTFDQLFSVGPISNRTPPAVKLQMQGLVNLETLILTDNLINFMADAYKYVTETIVWPDYHRRFTKYRPFLNWVDRSKTKRILLSVFS